MPKQIRHWMGLVWKKCPVSIVQHVCATKNNIHFMSTLSNLFTENTTRLIFLGKRINAQYLINKRAKCRIFFGEQKNSTVHLLDSLEYYIT